MFSLEYAKNLAWNDSEKSTISMVVKFSEFSFDLPFTASPLDPEPHGREIFNKAIAGEFGDIASYKKYDE